MGLSEGSYYNGGYWWGPLREVLQGWLLVGPSERGITRVVIGGAL